MRNAINNTRMAKRNLIGKTLFRATMLLAIFIFVFAFVCVIADVNLVSQNKNGKLDNVAEASGNSASTVISLTETAIFTNPSSTSAININPDVSKRGKYWSTNDTNIEVNVRTWSTGNGSTGGTWGIGHSDSHSGTDYAHCWFDYDLGANWNKLNGSLQVTVTGNLSKDSNGWFGATQISGFYVAIGSSSTAYSTITNGGTGYDTDVKNNSSVTKTSESQTGSITLNHTVAGRYVRIYYVTYSTTGGYGWTDFTGVKVSISRTKPSFNFSYNKNNNSATGTVSNTSHEYMTNKAVAANNYTLDKYMQTRWDSNSSGNGVSLAFGAGIGTSIGSGTIGEHIRTNLIAGTTTIPLYAVYQEIGFSFGGVNYSTFNDSAVDLQILASKTGSTYISGYNNPSGFTSTITYSSDGSTYNSTRPTNEGTYYAKITVTSSVSSTSYTRGTRVIQFSVVPGDYGTLTSGVSGTWGSSTNPYVISTPTHLSNLAGIVNGTKTALNSIVGVNGVASGEAQATSITYEGCYFIVTSNITANSAFVAIGKDSTKCFSGHIYGGTAVNTYAEMTITLNLTSSASNYVGLFGYIKGTESVRASVRSLKTSGSISASGKSYVGGICGYAVYTDFENCANTASITAGDNNGGVFGYILATTTLKGTFSNTGSVSGSTGSGYVGGIGGDVRSTLTNCTFTNTGSVTASGGYVGGIFGKLDAQNKSNSKILSASNTATVSASGKTYVGGIIGIADNVTIQGATNSGAVTGGQYTGGIFGKIATSTITGAYTTTGSNTVTGSTSYVGGIAGYLDGVSNASSSITASNTKAVSASGAQYTAGIAGYALNITITSGSNTGNISGGSHTAGIFGHSTNTVIMNGTFTNGTNGSSVGTINGTGGMCGGIGGQTHAALKTTSTFANYGSVTGGGDSVGGLFGFFDNIESNVAMRNAGAVTGKSSLGGIVGRAQRGLVATNTYPITNSGTITYTGGTTSGELGGTYSAVGGIAGYINNNIEKATNTGAITVSSGNAASAVGGILGINHNGYNISIISCTNSGAITSGGNYTGGIVGRLSTSTTKNVQGCSNSGNISGAGYVGGIAGYLNGYTISTSCSNTGTVTGSGDRVGGFVGEANSLTVSLALSNSKAVTGAQYVGGIFGNMNSGCDLGSYAFSNSAQIKGTSYVGGIFGNCPGVASSSGANSLHNLTNSGTIIGSTERVGGLIGSNSATIAGTMTNTASVYGYTSASTNTGESYRTAKYVGGLIGFNTGDISSATISNFSSAINVTGAGYVGGLIGATYGTRIAIGTSVTIKINLYGGGNSSHDYGFIGGVFGYVAGTGAETTNTTLDPNTATNNYFRFTKTSLTVVLKVNGYGGYVGKIAGYATGISIENLSANDASGSFVTNNNDSISSSNSSFIGGIVGYLAFTPIHQESITPTTSKSSYFGYVGTTSATSGTAVQPGYVYSINVSYTVESTNYNVTVYFSPSIQGTITTLPTYDPTTNTFTNVVIKESNTFIDAVGGVTANTYLGTSIYGRYGNVIAISGKSYVGGVIGKIDSGVGNLQSGTRGAANSIYYLGGNQNLYLENTGTITSSYYFVGGLIGGLANTTGSDILQTHVYAHLANTGTIGTSAYTSCVGGLIGGVGTIADIDSGKYYVAACIDGTTTGNVANGSYNGDASTTIRGSYYVGGAVGFMGSNPNNYVDSFINVAQIQGTSGNYVGGIVGYMGAGRASTNGSSLNKCVSTPTGSVLSSTSYYIGDMYVGGIVGQAGNVSINNCYTLGFAYGEVSSNCGGICGNVMPSTSITDSWAILYVGNLNHADNYNNGNGNFIMVGANSNWKIPSYDELLYEAGLTNVAPSAVSSSANTTAEQGYITLKLAIPGVGGGTNENYIAFFTGNGNREPSGNLYTNYTQDIGGFAGKIYNDGNYMYVKVYLAQASSFSVCYESAQFVNVESTSSSAYDGLSTAKKIENWTAGFNNGRFSDQYVADFSSAPTLSGSTFTVVCNVYYKNLMTGYSSDTWLAGVINKSFSTGTSTLPYTISTVQQWNEFAGYVRNNNSTYIAAYWKVLKDISLGTYNSSSNNYLVGSASYQFRGTLDGNGKTITYTYTNAGNDAGLFPYIGSGATLKNIRLAGTLTSSGKGVGALIGSAQNGCTIQNVRSSVAVQGTYHVGGLIGYVSANLNLKDIALTGSVTGTTYDASGGTGGIIGTVYSGTTTIDSARNAGTVMGEANSGGVVGCVYGTVTVTNSCNTGTVEERSRVKDRLSYIGGICGKCTAAGGINIYACYNSGVVWGKCARVGGLIGCDTDSVSSSSGRTKVYYSFNSGHVYSGHYNYREEVYGGNNSFTYYGGGECGGLVGMAIAVDMYCSYNIGTVTSFGVISHLYENQSRTGGLVGLMYNYQGNYYCTMKYCYNAGLVQNRCTLDNCIYLSGLVGCSILERNGIWTFDVLKYWHGADNMPSGSVEYNYSMNGQVDLGKKDGTTGSLDMTRGSTYTDVDGYFGVDHNFAFLENYRESNNYLYLNCVYWAANWTLQDTLVDATAMVSRYDASAQCGMIPSGLSGWQSAGGTYGKTDVLRNSTITSSSNFGYIYIPGCLPQLSIFATDTESGVAMTGSTSGFNTETQTYELKSAGTEYSPYVIQNAIDLLGLSTLVAINDGYHGTNRFFAFANGFNNLDGRNLDDGIDMNTLDLTMTHLTFTGQTPGTTTQRIALVYTVTVIGQNGTTTTNVQSFYTATNGYGKNRLLFRNANNNVLAGTATNENFLQIGSTSGRHFSGTLDGYKKVVGGVEYSYPIIRNVKIKRTAANDTNQCYAAFIGYGENCTVRNFTIENPAITVSGSVQNSYVATFVAKAMGKSTLSGLVATSSSNSLTITNATTNTYAAGICAYASPNSSSNGGYSTHINDCKSSAIVTVNSTGTYNNIGGILGYANGVANRSDVGVFIDECSVTGGTLTNASTQTNNIGTGGIVGFRNTIGRLDITNCEVGNGANSANVTIKGNHTVGGIISRTNGETATHITNISNCTVGNKTTICKERTNAISTTHGTAFGGFIGYAKQCQLTGTNTFSGTIKVGTTGSYVAGTNIGGLIGYLGTGTKLQGNINIDGSIDAGSTIASNTASSRIGGAIGYVPAGSNNIDGQFYINPQMTTANSSYVGGFIGYNDASLYILGSSSIVDLTGSSSAENEAQMALDSNVARSTDVTINTITAKEYVGGFIGRNNGTIYVGSQKDLDDQDSIGTFTANLVANVNGNRYVGGFVGYNNGTITTDNCKANVTNAGNICNAAAYKTSTEIGGIVGYNASSATFAVEEQENYFANSGTIGYNISDSTVQYAGGVVGYNAGTFTNIGTLANTGAIYGNQYVAGSIGYFNSGTLYGTMINGVAQTSTDGDTVSRSYSTSVTRITAGTTMLNNPTTIALEQEVTQGNNYKYSIGKINYYFVASISGTIKGFENENVTILGKQKLTSSTNLINNTNNITANSTVLSPTVTYNYSNGSPAVSYYYYSTVYGMVQSVSKNTITLYPTLEAVAIGETSGYTSLGTSVNKAKYYYSSGSTYGFDGTDLIGTVAYKSGSAVAFSSLQIEASREPLTGTMTAYEGLRITKGNKYKFYVGTVPYFFEAKVTGIISTIIGNVLTITSFTEEAYGRVQNGSAVEKGHYYVLNNGSEYYFYATVNGKINSISDTIVEQQIVNNTIQNVSYPAVSINTTIEASRSAIASPTDLGIGGHVNAGTNYMFVYGGNNYYFTAPYTGDLTYLGHDGTSVKYGITNTDYTDMLASSKDADSHSGYVSGVTNIGGVVSVVNQATTVGVYKENGNFVPGVYTRLINFGTVQSTSGENVGGSIGQMAGTIAGETVNAVTQYVEFFNYGNVNVVKNGGGCIGIYSGNGTLVQMFNYQNTNIYDVSGNNLYENIGGCIGIVKKPASGYAVLRNAIVVNSGVVRAYTTRSGVTGTGFGGVIGTIDDNAVQSEANWSVDLYSDGSVYCGTQANGQSNAGQFSRVGGLIGAIGTPTGAGAPIVLKSVLNYTKRSGTGAQSTVTAVSGYDYVGGILGLNNSSITAEGSNASVRYCYNVGGEVWGHYSSGTVGGIVGKEGSNSPNTYCCYWISAFANSALQNAKVDSLGTTLTRGWTTVFSAQDVNNGIYSPNTWEEYFAVLKAFLGNGGISSGYFTDGTDDYYLENYTYELQEEILDENDEVIGYDYSYIDFYDIFFTNNYLSIREAAQNYYNDILNGGLDLTTISTDTDIPLITTIHDINSSTESIRVKGEAEYDNLQDVVGDYLDRTFELNDAGDIGYYDSVTEATKSYSTGSVKTGYFFAYAKDDLPEYSDRDIETEHTRSGAVADYDLRMWKYISQAYGNTETNNSISNIIYNYSPSSTDSNGYVDKSGSSAQLYHIYARAYMPTKTVAGITTPTGYYLYAQAQESSGLVVSYNAVIGSEAFYIDADSATCKNVLIFYKQVVVTTKLTYNGLERSAPISGLTATESKNPQASYYGFNEHADVNGIAFNTGIDVGTYYLDASIFYIPDNAYIFSTSSGSTGTQINITTLAKAQETLLIPGNSYYFTIDATSYTFSIPNSIAFPNNDSTYTAGYGWLKILPTAGGQKVYVVCPVTVGKALSNTNANPVTYTWRIWERKLSAVAVNKTKTSGPNALFYDKTTKETTITITNVVDVDTTLGTYTTERAMEALKMYFKLTFNPTLSDANTNSWSCNISNDVNVTSSNGYSGKDGGYCVGTKTYKTVKYVYTLSAINAGTYTIKTEKDNGADKADNYSMASAIATLLINKKTLTATWTGDEAIEYDGATHTLTLQISGWAVGETVGTTGTTGTVLNWANVNMTHTGLTKGSLSCSNQSSGKTTASSVVSIPYTAKNIGSYRITWSTLTLGNNYSLPNGSTDPLSISAMVLVATQYSQWGTHTYDGTDNHEYKIKIVSQSDKTVPAALITEILNKVKGTKSYENGGTGATDSKENTISNKINIIVTFKAKHAGKYKFGLEAISEASGNYGMTAFTTGTKQTISQKSLTITGKNIGNESYGAGSYNYVYNQSKQGLGTITITGFVNSTDASTVRTNGMNLSLSNVSLNHSTSGSTNTYTCGVANVGSYHVGMGLNTSNSTASNYTLVYSDWYWNITSLNIRCTWSSTENYTYTGSARTRPLASIAIYNGETPVSGLEVVSPSSSTVNTQTFNVSVTGAYIDIITLTLVTTEAIAVGNNYSCSVSSFTLTGTNAAGNSIDDNYSLTSANTTFNVVKSRVTVDTKSGLIISKEYDNTINMPAGINPTGSLTLTFTSSNGGATTPGFSVTSAHYDTPTVGTGKTITYAISLNDTANYTYTGSAFTIDNGEITQKEIQIVVYKKGADISKVYDNTTFFGGASGAIYSAGTTMRSIIYRSGNGFEVRNIMSNETAGALSVTAVFQEVNRNRYMFDQYINNVVENNGNYSISTTDMYYKQIVFTVSGTSALNYSYVLTDGLTTYGTSTGYTLSYTDNEDATMHVLITKYTVNISYGNTYQSYAQTKNEYTYENVGWLPVTAQLPANSNISPSLGITITNTWMYENHLDMTDGWAKIVSYTRKTGKPNSTLYAVLGGANGIALNYQIKAQPVLVIDYFVSNGDNYEITTLAGLLLATYYYKNYATLGEDDKIYSYSWTQACNDSDYETYMAEHPTAQLEFDPATNYWGYWTATEVIPDKYEKFILNADISGIMTALDYDVLKNAFGTYNGDPVWGYGMGHMIEGNYVTYLDNFMQTTIGEEVVVIGNFFADEFDGSFDGNGYVIKNFTQIYNVTAPSQTELNIGFFGKTTAEASVVDMSLREYKLYVYDYTGNANTLNIGALVGLSVMNTSLTNSTIHASVNVIVSGNNELINAGILMGRYEGTITGADESGSNEYEVVVAIENVITLGNLIVDNASGSALAGGILGSIGVNSSNGSAVFGAITFADINVTASTSMVGGLIGYAGNDTSISATILAANPNCFTYLNSGGAAIYLANSTIYRANNSAEWVVSSRAIGNVNNSSDNSIRILAGTTYSNIITNSNTAYNSTYRPEATTTKGIFDIISETTAGSESKYKSYVTSTAGASSAEPRESKRLSDMIKAYILKLYISETTISATINAVSVNLRVYRIASSNTLLGTALGTSNSKIALSYSQQVVMLRMFRFAEFELKKQINLPVNYYNIVYGGIFYGNVTTTAVQVISTSGYTARKISNKTYATLEEYKEAYEEYYNVTLTTSGGYFVYTPSIYVYNKTNSTDKMFEKEINVVPIDWVRDE